MGRKAWGGWPVERSLFILWTEGWWIFQLFHRSEYRWHCSRSVPPHLPAFRSSLPLSSHPILPPNRGAVYESAGGLRFSATSCSFFKLSSQVTGELRCFQCARSFKGEVLPSEVMVQSGLRAAPISPRAIPVPPPRSPRSPCAPGAGLPPAAEWWPRWAREARRRSEQLSAVPGAWRGPVEFLKSLYLRIFFHVRLHILAKMRII